MIKVLAVASEVFPLVKTGGLADVAGALPGALAMHDIQTTVLVPGYPAVTSALQQSSTVFRYENLFGGQANVLAGSAAGLALLVVDAPHLFNRTGDPYLGPDRLDWTDNWARFAALSFVAADIGKGAVPSFIPSIVHAHDWQAALSAVYLHFHDGPKAKTIVTIHNLAFQGTFPASTFKSLALPDRAYSVNGIEFFGKVSFLKGGLQFADAITTVSPTYAEEICTPAGGMGLDGLLRERADMLTGIVNGVDTSVWDPESDPHVPATYGAGSLGRRKQNKRAIEKRFALDENDGPLFCVISRLTEQKGMDVLAESIDSLVEAGGRLVVLGAGEAALERRLASAGSRYPGSVGILVGWSELLAHLLQAGADAIVIPSRFEPCGLTQFYGLRYGCVPIAARVGGLADSLIDANEAALNAGVATGVQFFPVDAPTLRRTLTRTVALYRDRKVWVSMQKRGMKVDVSWTRSAARYARLYRTLSQS